MVGLAWDLRAEIAQTPARTMAGFVGKARVVQRFCNCDPGYAIPTHDDAVAWSLAKRSAAPREHVVRPHP
jgi:hypothetical protein